MFVYTVSYMFVLHCKYLYIYIFIYLYLYTYIWGCPKMRGNPMAPVRHLPNDRFASTAGALRYSATATVG